MAIDTTYLDADTDKIKAARASLLAAVQRCNTLEAAGDFVLSDAGGSISAAVAAIGATISRLVVNSPVVLSANVTIPSTLTLVVEGHGLITTTGYTLTINGPFECGIRQCFSGSGSVSFGEGSISEAFPQWWGAQGDFSADATAAINTAILASTSVALVGKLRVDGQININRDGVVLRGRGMKNSQLKFNPASGPATMIKIQAAIPANLIQQCALLDFGVLATYPTAIRKTAIEIIDGSLMRIENVNSVDYSWQGGAYSVFLSMNGRDQHTVRNCYIAADRPILAGPNPNSTQFQFDCHHFNDLAMQALDGSQYAITFLPGVNISQWLMDGRCIAMTGKGGIFHNDTNVGTVASSQITIDNFRIESGVASGGLGGGYGMQFTFGAGNPQCGNIRISNSSVNDGTCNGYYFDGVSVMELTNLNCGFAAANVALSLNNVGLAVLTSIGVAHDSAVINTPNMNVRRLDKFYSSYAAPANPSIGYGLYTYYDVDSPARNIQIEDGVVKWGRKQAMSNGQSMLLPALAVGGSMLVDVWCSSGYARYWIGYGAGNVLLAYGNAAFGVSGAGSISAVVSAGGVSNITNVSAGAITLMVTAMAS